MPKAMVLAAGRGERMRPLTDHCPKPLLKAGGKPLLQWHIEALVQAGFCDIVINHAHLGQQIEDFLGDGHCLGARLSYSPEPLALETAGGIRQALHFFENAPFLVVNGDVFSDWPRAQAHSWIANWQADCLAHLMLVENPSHNPTGDFVLNRDGSVSVKSPNAPEGRTLTFSGVGVYHPALFSDLPVGQAAKLAPMLQHAMAQGRVRGVLFEGGWMDIGTPDRLAQLDARLQQSLVHPNPKDVS